MKKTEYIERYGAEAYEAYKVKACNHMKERYANDAEYREHMKNRYNNDIEFRNVHKMRVKSYKKTHYNIDEEFTLNTRLSNTLHRYCRRDEESKIENYELAKADNFKGWDIHHRLELTLDGEYAHTPEELKRMNMYYNRPYYELIFLTRADHNKLHKGTNK